MKPTADKILLEADKPVEKTESGIFLQEEWKTLPPFGTVVAVGPLVEDIKPGDRVVFERYGAIKTRGTKGEDLRLCKASHILALIEEAQTEQAQTEEEDA